MHGGGGPKGCATWAVAQGLQKLRTSKKNYMVVVLVNKRYKMKNLGLKMKDCGTKYLKFSLFQNERFIS
jgi:hypothetical protein